MRHSPIINMVRSFFIGNEFLYRFLFSNLMIVSIFYFYKCIKIKFNEDGRTIYLYLPIILFLFPTFRSYSYWPDPHLIGFLFFALSVYFYISFKNIKLNKKKNEYAILNTISLALSAYFSPNYGVFFLYFIVNFFFHYKFSKYFLIILLLNLLLGLPFLSYLFYFDVNFIFGNPTEGFDVGENIFSIKNFSNKIILILSLIFFYQFPILISGIINFNFSYLKRYFVYLFLIICIFFLFCLNFDFSSAYRITNSGGGIVYLISNFLFENNFFLFFVSFLSLIIQFIISKNLVNNLFLFICIVLSHPQETLWQANFSPILYFLFFTLFSLNFKNLKINNQIIFLILNYSYFMMFYIISYFKNFFLTYHA